MSVPNVQLPTGYFIGMSAATGDLSDNHDVVSIRFFDIEYSRPEQPFAPDRSKLEPHSEQTAVPRDHIDDPRPSKMGWFSTLLLVLVAIVVIGGVLGFGFHFFQQRSLHQRKRFY